MYADRYSQRTKFDPASMGLALALNGTIVIGLIAFAAPTMVHRIIDPPITVITVAPPSPPPPPEPAKPEVKSQMPTPLERVVVPETIVPTPTVDHPYVAPPTPPGPIGGTIDGGFVAPIKPPPVMVGAKRDLRFADSFQPEYPAGERRAEHQGRVVVRVLIGVDGRVKQVQKVSAASDAFFEATERRALQKWRFKPATRDGVPIETWDTLAVSFVLNDE